MDYTNLGAKIKISSFKLFPVSIRYSVTDMQRQLIQAKYVDREVGPFL